MSDGHLTMFGWRGHKMAFELLAGQIPNFTGVGFGFETPHGRAYHCPRSKDLKTGSPIC